MGTVGFTYGSPPSRRALLLCACGRHLRHLPIPARSGYIRAMYGIHCLWLCFVVVEIMHHVAATAKNTPDILFGQLGQGPAKMDMMPSRVLVRPGISPWFYPTFTRAPPGSQAARLPGGTQWGNRSEVQSLFRRSASALLFLSVKRDSHAFYCIVYRRRMMNY